MMYLWMLLFIIKLHVVENTFLRQSDDPHFAGRNIALGQETEQSGDYKDEIASNAVDGNTDTSVQYGKCAHTSLSHGSSWWRVYFDNPYIIAGIIIYSRSNEKSRHRLKNFEVTGFVEGLNEGRTLYNDSKLQQYTERIIMLRIDIYVNVKFKSAMISVPPNFNETVDNGNSMVTVCEVEIYTPIATDQVRGEVSDTSTFATDHVRGEVSDTNIFATDQVRGEVSDTNTFATDQVRGEVSDTNIFEVYTIVGAISGASGAVIATMVLLTICIDKCRRNKAERRLTKLRTAKRNTQTKDYNMSGDLEEVYEMVV